MEQIVDASPGLPVLDAPVPLMVDVLPFMEAAEEARMDQIEDLILEGAKS